MLLSFDSNSLVFHVISIELEFVQKVPEKIICKKMGSELKSLPCKISSGLFLSLIWACVFKIHFFSVYIPIT